MLPELPDNPSTELMLEHINFFKGKALKLLVNTIKAPDAKYLDPNDLKKLTDTALVIEDSLKEGGEEGKAARAMQSLLEKYGDTGYDPNYTPQPLTIEGKVIDNA